jgi:PAS domain S-box-containing protein
MKGKNSIRKRLVILLIILSISPLLLLGTILSWQSYLIQEKQAKDLQQEVSKRALNKIYSFIREQETILRVALKTNDVMKMNYEDLRRFFIKLRTYKDKNYKDVFDELTLLDGNGREIFRISRTAILTLNDLSNRSQSDEFIIPLLTRKTYYSPVDFNEETSEPFLTMSIPIINVRHDQVQGVLVSRLRLKFMWDIIAKVPVGERGVAYILDQDGRVIAHPNPSVVLRGTRYEKMDKYTGIRPGLNGTKVVMDCNQIQLGGQTFHIVTERPISEALKQTYRSLVLIGIFLLFTLSGAIALGFVVIRKIIRPIESLSQTARAITAGDLSRKSEISGNDEIGVLSKAFNTMTSQLVDTIDSLKQHIIERDSANRALKEKTDELQKLNEYLKKEIEEHKRTETALRESHERLLLVLDSLDSAVYVADMKTYEILFVNKYTRRDFGDIEGKICWQTFQSNQSGPCSFCTNNKLLTDKGEPAGVYRWEFQNTKNGRWYYIQDRAIYWVDGRIVRLEIATDITERKRMENDLNESREKYRKLIETANDAIFVAEVETGIIIDANSKAEKLIGRKRDEIIGMHQSELYPKEERSRYLEIFQKYGRQEISTTGELFIAHKDGG